MKLTVAITLIRKKLMFNFFLKLWRGECRQHRVSGQREVIVVGLFPKLVIVISLKPCLKIIIFIFLFEVQLLI